MTATTNVSSNDYSWLSGNSRLITKKDKFNAIIAGFVVLAIAVISLVLLSA